MNMIIRLGSDDATTAVTRGKLIRLSPRIRSKILAAVRDHNLQTCDLIRILQPYIFLYWRDIV